MQLRCSIVVSISACHAEDPGSIPGRGVFGKLCEFHGGCYARPQGVRGKLRKFHRKWLVQLLLAMLLRWQLSEFENHRTLPYCAHGAAGSCPVLWGAGIRPVLSTCKGAARRNGTHTTALPQCLLLCSDDALVVHKLGTLVSNISGAALDLAVAGSIAVCKLLALAHSRVPCCPRHRCTRHLGQGRCTPQSVKTKGGKQNIRRNLWLPHDGGGGTAFPPAFAMRSEAWSIPPGS